MNDLQEKTYNNFEDLVCLHMGASDFYQKLATVTDSPSLTNEILSIGEEHRKMALDIRYCIPHRYRSAFRKKLFYTPVGLHRFWCRIWKMWRISVRHSLFRHLLNMEQNISATYAETLANIPLQEKEAFSKAAVNHLRCEDFIRTIQRLKNNFLPCPNGHLPQSEISRHS